MKTPRPADLVSAILCCLVTLSLGCFGQEGPPADQGSPSELAMEAMSETPNALNWHRWYPMFRGQAPGQTYRNFWTKNPDHCNPAAAGQAIQRIANPPPALPRYDSDGHERVYYHNFATAVPGPDVVSQIITLSADGLDLEHWAAGKGLGTHSIEQFLGDPEEVKHYTTWNIHFVFPSTGTTLELPVTDATKEAFASCTKAYFDAHPEIDWDAWLLDPNNRAPRKLRLPNDENGAMAYGNYTCELAFVTGYSPINKAMISWAGSGPRAQNSKQLVSVDAFGRHHRILENINYRYMLPESRRHVVMNQYPERCSGGDGYCWWITSSEVYTLSEVEPAVQGSPQEGFALPPAFTDYHCFKFNRSGEPNNTSMLCENTCDPSVDPFCAPNCSLWDAECKPNLQYKACDGDTVFDDVVLY